MCMKAVNNSFIWMLWRWTMFYLKTPVCEYAILLRWKPPVNYFYVPENAKMYFEKGEHQNWKLYS